MTNEKKPLLFEVCCGSAEDAIEAAKGGAQSAGRQNPGQNMGKLPKMHPCAGKGAAVVL